MRRLILAAGLLPVLTVGAAAEDIRTAIDLPPDMKVQFLEHMRTHMTTLNSVIELMAAGKFRDAGALARNEMAIGKGMGIGRYMPQQFRDMGFGFHKAADEFATVTAGLSEPMDAAGWAAATKGLAQITAHCAACHGTFRVK
jgi:hypothetical protein